MSNSLAIAAVTATLRELLAKGLADEPDSIVTTKPLDHARDDNEHRHQLNLFLYSVAYNAAWRNADLPRVTRPGEIGFPALPLNLYYLLTAYSRGNDDPDPKSHELLGKAMRILHDHTLLDATEIKAAAPNSDLADQIERVRITPHALTLEDMSKLWTAVQAQYRISVAYEVAVVLIESERAARTPLPVLKRGQDDQGVFATAASSPFLFEARPPRFKPSATLGDDLTVTGRQMVSENVIVRFSHPRLAAPIEIAPAAGSGEDELIVHLPSPAEDAAAIDKWVAGLYTVSLLIQHPDLPAWSSNEVAMAVAPVITIAPLNAPAGDLTLSVSCTPRIRPGQKTSLLFGERQVAPADIDTPADPTQPSVLTFEIPAVAPGKYVVRLRVDGVDSLPFTASGTPLQLGFDPNQTVTIT